MMMSPAQGAKILLQALAVLILFVLLVTLLTKDYSPSQKEQIQTHHSALADRINAACKKNFQVYDWSVGDEYHTVPAGIIEVTCARYYKDGTYDTYKTAVAR